MRYKRRANAYRPAKKRLKDWKEIYNHPKDKELKVQTARSDLASSFIDPVLLQEES